MHSAPLPERGHGTEEEKSRGPAQHLRVTEGRGGLHSAITESTYQYPLPIAMIGYIVINVYGTDNMMLCVHI